MSAISPQISVNGNVINETFSVNVTYSYNKTIVSFYTEINETNMDYMQNFIDLGITNTVVISHPNTTIANRTINNAQISNSITYYEGQSKMQFNFIGDEAL